MPILSIRCCPWLQPGETLECGFPGSILARAWSEEPGSIQMIQVLCVGRLWSGDGDILETWISDNGDKATHVVVC